MNQRLAHIAVLVDDYDEAIAFYTQKLNFALVEDTALSSSKRWVLVKPKGDEGCSILLAKGVNDLQKSRIGNQTGGRVFLFLYTDDFNRDYQNLIKNNVKIIGEPRHEKYGIVAVFEDLYGNRWDLIEPAK
ncbi:VOC family protein [Chryseobacterium aureum]|uniref:VOC family protein n=1 Tax=Chryseobacterium aureum TaxID=2497456 RepID=UPI000F87F89E|nr:VOC family protein [Chryseobacterium aureum]